MKRFAAGVVTGATLLAVGALAQGHVQQGMQQQQQQQQEQQQFMDQHRQQMQQEPTRTMRMQASIEELDGVMTHMRSLKQWMDQNGTEHGLREMGQAMLEAGDRMQVMLKRMDQICQSCDEQHDRDRLQKMDRLQEQLRTMTHQMKEAHETLTQIVGAPA